MSVEHARDLSEPLMSQCTHKVLCKKVPERWLLALRPVRRVLRVKYSVPIGNRPVQHLTSLLELFSSCLLRLLCPLGIPVSLLPVAPILSLQEPVEDGRTGLPEMSKLCNAGRPLTLPSFRTCQLPFRPAVSGKTKHDNAVVQIW